MRLWKAGYLRARMRVAIAQMNSIVGALERNAAVISDKIDEAREAAADIVLFPELALTGYPPEDLLLRPAFAEAARTLIDELAPATRGITALVGTPLLEDDLFNACAVLADGKVTGFYRKRFLPNYGVFDEQRLFAAGRGLLMLNRGPLKLGLTICEDIWLPGPPASDLTLAGAQVILNISASPFHLNKGAARERMLATRAADLSAYVVYCNLVGGQDELVFDGQSLVFGPDGELIARGAAFEEEMLVVDIDPLTVVGRRLRDTRPRARAREQAAVDTDTVEIPFPAQSGHRSLAARSVAPELDRLEQLRRALVLGLQDYVGKNGFGDVVLGMSGGIDSALTAALAVDALGPERVHAVSMPSRFSSGGTRSDAQRQSEVLGIDFREIPIEESFETVSSALHPSFDGFAPDVAEENIQARLRGLIVMALSNKFGWLALTTGNKSEVAVGYATLYGDMVGGFSLLKDVYKTDVFALSRYLNERAGREVVLESIIERPPSAELREDQRDDQALPPYDVLDPLLAAYIEDDLSMAEIIDLGLENEQTVSRIVRLVDVAEYKRRQAAPGVKVHVRAFGRDRRMPITNGWRG